MSQGNATADLFRDGVGSYFVTAVCPSWLPTNHLLFQLANIFLFLSYMAPPGLHGLLYLRVCLTLGSFFFALWGYVILCAFDTMVWNAFFTAINLVHTCVVMYILRPVRLQPDMEVVYREVFEPLKVSRQQFQPAAASVKAVVDLHEKETYSQEGVTRADCLTLVLKGRCLASQKGRPLQIVDRLEFLDSPEWFGVCSGDSFQVTTTALERCRLVVWNRDKLKLTISATVRETSSQFSSIAEDIFDQQYGGDSAKRRAHGCLHSPSRGPQDGPDARRSRSWSPRSGKGSRQASGPLVCPRQQLRRDKLCEARRSPVCRAPDQPHQG